MKWEEIKAWLEENSKDEKVKEFINQNADAQEVSLDKVKELAEKDKDVKGWLDGEKDRHHSKALETWKTNNLEKLVDEKVNERNPEKTPEQKELARLQKQFEEMENAKNRETLKNKALSVASEKNIPNALVDFLLGQDEGSTLENMKMFEEHMQTHIQSKVDERLNENSYTPPKDTKGNTITREQIEKMTPEEINENWEQVSSVLENER